MHTVLIERIPLLRVEGIPLLRVEEIPLLRVEGIPLLRVDGIPLLRVECCLHKQHTKPHTKQYGCHMFHFSYGVYFV
jgi:hypothetical protein